MTIVGDTVALNIILGAFGFFVLMNNDKNVASSQIHTQFKTKVQKPCPI